MSIGQPEALTSEASASQIPPLAAETLPASQREVDYPEMTRMHAASVLTTPAEVVAWRRPFTMPPVQSTGPLYPLQPLAPSMPPPETLGTAVRQRGSTRRFARESIAFSQLSAVLDHSTRGIPADFLDRDRPSLLDIYLIANAVDGLPSGSYVWSPAGRALELLRAGAFRQEAGHLCFEQALGADASAVVFFLANLDGVLQRFGNRGYRAAQLEAGTIGGKMYLCAYALGLGASGLTFYDDEVTAFFSPHAADQRTIFVVVLGKTASANRVRPFRSQVGMVIDALSRKDA